MNSNKKSIPARGLPPPVNRQAVTARPFKPAVAQLKTPASAQSIKRPVAPPVYRPNTTPKAVQPKMANGVVNRKAPVAPPVYRPEAKKIVQPKAVSQLRMPPTAPPVYRPQQTKIAQPKMASAAKSPLRPKAAPAVHKPQPKAPGIKAPPPNTRQPTRSADRKPTAIQLYSVLPPTRVMREMPNMVGKPEPGLPYVVVADAEFLAQQSLPERSGSNKGHDFLREQGGNEAHIVGRPLGATIRLSDDCRMAIEDSDLSRRQPKEFYATSGIVRESNTALERVGANVRLVQGAHAMTVVSDRREVIALYTVTPRFVRTPPQNCNAMAAEIIGSSSAFTAMKKSAGMIAAKKVAAKSAALLDKAWHDKGVSKEAFEKLEGAVVAEYVGSLAESKDVLAEHGINRYAQPGVGEAYMIGTLGNPTSQDGGVARVVDLESGEERRLGWGFHFAGVVAVSGNDRVTLENYARGDDRRDDPDPRWFFQMYGGSGGQTFYDFHKAKREFSNPVVVAVRK